MAALTRKARPRYILGAHIELIRAPGQDCRDAAPRRPDEHVLELSAADLLELQAAVRKMGGAVTRSVHDDLIVFPIPPRK